MQFKEILRDLREEKNLSQKQVAEGCKLSPTCVSQLETGARNPTGSTLHQLADFFECSTDYLLGRSDELGVISIQSERSAPALSAEELRLIENYRKIPEDLQRRATAYVQKLVDLIDDEPTVFTQEKQRKNKHA